jgi:hypothetical protein
MGKTARRKRLYENISCITVDADCGEYEFKGLSYFDVPQEPYIHGCQTGTKLVFEMLKEAAHDDGLECLQKMLEASFKEIGAPGDDIEVESKRGAAVGFICTLQEVFNFAASRLDFSEVFKNTFDCYESDLEEQLVSIRTEHAEMLAALAANATPVTPITPKRGAKHV